MQNRLWIKCRMVVDQSLSNSNNKWMQTHLVDLQSSEEDHLKVVWLKERVEVAHHGQVEEQGQECLWIDLLLLPYRVHQALNRHNNSQQACLIVLLSLWVQKMKAQVIKNRPAMPHILFIKMNTKHLKVIIKEVFLSRQNLSFHNKINLMKSVNLLFRVQLNPFSEKHQMKRSNKIHKINRIKYSKR